MTDIKLIAIDMDHTLLNDDGQIPETFTQQVLDLKKQGTRVAIASGRPLYTLEEMFSHLADDLIFVTDNGAAITLHGEQLYNSIIEPDDYKELLTFTLSQEEAEGVPIICALDAAYIPKAQDQYETTYRKFYSNIHYYDDFSDVDVVANKFTIYTPNNDAVDQFNTIYDAALSNQFSATTSGKEWIDIMNKNIDKGSALHHLAETFDISPKQMMAFGDNYNDIEMLDVVEYSYAMDNAHQDIKDHAKYIAPSNNDYGVSIILQQLLDGEL